MQQRAKRLDARHCGPELPHLPGYHQIDDITHQHDADKNGAAACALIVISARGLNLDLGLRRMLRDSVMRLLLTVKISWILYRKGHKQNAKLWFKRELQTVV